MNLLNEREKTHGDYSLVSAVSQALKAALRLGPFDELPSIMRESLEMKCVKFARIVCGDHNEPDHWIDDIGYSQLSLDHIKKDLSPGDNSKEPPDELRKVCCRDPECIGHKPIFVDGRDSRFYPNPAAYR